MIKTSQRILDQLQSNGPLTVAQLSGLLGRTKADIREQMSFLLAKNLVVGLPSVSTETPGRPAARFMVTQKPPEQLINGLISGLILMMTNNKIDQKYIQEINVSIANALLADFQPYGSSAASRLNQAIVFIERLGIFTKWIATKNGPRITIVHESISPLFQDPSISKKIVKQIIQTAKEKAVGYSPTA